MRGPLDESISCFLIRVDPWVLVPIAFRGLHVLDFRGLHTLAFRGLHALAFRGLHVLAFRGLHALAFRGPHVFTFRGLHVLAFRGLHAFVFRGPHILTFRGLHVLAFSGLHALAFRGLHVLAFRGLHVLACRGLHVLAFRGLHVLAFRGLHILTFRGLHILTFRGLRVLAFRELHILAFRGSTSAPSENSRRANCASTTREGGYHATTMHIGARFHPYHHREMSTDHAHHHNSDLPLPKCQLVCVVMTYVRITPTRHPVDPEKSNRALGFPALVTGLWIVPTRHPVDPEKSNRALGFPALVTGLCQSYRVPVTPSKVIRPLITRPFVKKHRARHHNSLGTVSSRQQTYRHHLESPPQLIYKGWSVAYDMWPTSKRPTTRAELAVKKLPAKRSRKGTIEEGSSAALQADTGFDKHRFHRVEHQ
ncbi:Dynein heavy chain [Glycine soja]